MREIKFRCFAVQENEMIAPDDVLTIYDNRKLNESLISDDDHIFEQFTGLTDKNGVEIYEGDILSTDLSRPYLVVEFRAGAFMYQCHDSGDSYYDFMSPSDDPITQNKYCAVIGNIHQNPELLEQNDE